MIGADVRGLDGLMRKLRAEINAITQACPYCVPIKGVVSAKRNSIADLGIVYALVLSEISSV